MAPYTGAQTMVKFVVMFNTLDCGSEKNSLLKAGVSANKYLLLAVAPSVILQPIFHAKVLTLFDWVIILLSSSTIILAMEAAKSPFLNEVHQLRSGCALKQSSEPHDLIAYI